jgi:hypothetical protein
MTTKRPKRPLVEFYIASPRLSRAYRRVAKRNQSLGRFATIHELSDAGPAHIQTGHVQTVVLSDVEDDHSPLFESRVEPVVSRAFHLLFTGPTTHPDQVAQWIRSTRIRSENRLHVVRLDDMEGPAMSQLLRRVGFALGADGGHPSIIDAYVVGERLCVRGPKHRMLHVPVSSIVALRGQPPAVVRNFSMDPDGSFLYWPDLDVHLGWDQLLQAVDPAEMLKAKQRAAGFNKRYGAAIRRLRELRGIRQSQVDGLTERQLRRIEQGESRATPSAITALAKAHGLDANSYMDKLANDLD